MSQERTFYEILILFQQFIRYKQYLSNGRGDMIVCKINCIMFILRVASGQRKNVFMILSLFTLSMFFRYPLFFSQLKVTIDLEDEPHMLNDYIYIYIYIHLSAKMSKTNKLGVTFHKF